MIAVILQNGRPVSYASKALTLSQQNHAQLEKEISVCLLVAIPSMIICMDNYVK